jgi:hypothetical protein
LRETYREMSKQCKTSLKADRDAYFVKLSECVIAAFEDSSWSEAYRAVGSILRACRSKSKVTKHARVFNSSGVPAANVTEEKYVFRNHFANLLCGEACTFESVVLRDRIVPCDRFEGVHPECLSRCIPSLPELIVLF